MTGEHGVGMEKINQMCVQFSREELDAFLAVKRAFDPPCLLNPEKSSPRWHVAPNTARCMCMGRAELSRSRPLLGRTPYGFRPVGVVRPGHDGARRPQALFVMGGGSKSFYGNYRPVTPQDGHCLLDMTPYRGIVNYHPSELVVTVRAGTPLADLEAELAAHGQMLAFEPPHFGPAATVGGCVAAGLSGPRRMSAGALRDFVLGARLLDSDGRMLSFGGEVMKNVAGYDVSRLLAGSHGIFGALLEVSLAVVPKPMQEVTLARPATQAQALSCFAQWRGKPLPVSATSWSATPMAARACCACACPARRPRWPARGSRSAATRWNRTRRRPGGVAARADPHLLRTRQAAVAAGPAADRRRARSRSDAAGVGRRPALALWQLRGGAARARRQLGRARHAVPAGGHVRAGGWRVPSAGASAGADHAPPQARTPIPPGSSTPAA